PAESRSRWRWVERRGSTGTGSPTSTRSRRSRRPACTIARAFSLPRRRRRSTAPWPSPSASACPEVGGGPKVDTRLGRSPDGVASGGGGDLAVQAHAIDHRRAALRRGVRDGLVEEPLRRREILALAGRSPEAEVGLHPLGVADAALLGGKE